jgi:hypothetical protein
MVEPARAGPVRVGIGTTRLEMLLARFAPPPKTQSEFHRRCRLLSGPAANDGEASLPMGHKQQVTNP